MIQGLLGGGSSTNRVEYSTYVTSLKLLYSPYQFSFGNMIIGTGIEKEKMDNSYNSNTYGYAFNAKNSISTNYILFDAGLEFHPRHNIKLISMFEYGLGFNSYETIYFRNNRDNSEVGNDYNLFTQKIGGELLGLIAITDNFYMGLGFSKYSQEITSNEEAEFLEKGHFENGYLSLVLSYSL